MYQAATGHSRNDAGGKAGMNGNVTVLADPAPAERNNPITRRSLSALLLAPVALAAGASMPAMARGEDEGLKDKVEALRRAAAERYAASDDYYDAMDAYERAAEAMWPSLGEGGMVLYRDGVHYSWDEALENLRRETRNMERVKQELRESLRLEEKRKRLFDAEMAYVGAEGALLS